MKRNQATCTVHDGRPPPNKDQDPASDRLELDGVPIVDAGAVPSLTKSQTSQLLTAVLDGVHGLAVTVEVDLAAALPAFSIVGLGDAAVREARDRVRAAIRNAGFTLPPRRITVNLAPADRRKEGSGLDLPIALSILDAAGCVSPASSQPTVVIGELALDGRVRPCPGILPRLIAARDEGAVRALVPLGNLAEASLIDGVEVVGVVHLDEAARWYEGQQGGRTSVPHQPRQFQIPDAIDLCAVRGQDHARRALIVAAAGGHPLLLNGPPGAGKTLLARCLPSILPPLTQAEALEVLCIRSAAGLVTDDGVLPNARPLRAPHHTVSVPALVGGGKPIRPGEVSLAHRGVLFLDELPEFQRAALEALREPLEDGMVRVRRVHGAWELPACFQLIATMNPCPCGKSGTGNCSCPPQIARSYRARLSGPLRDRLDLVVRVEAVPYAVLSGAPSTIDSKTARARVWSARELQLERLAHRDDGERVNARMNGDEIRRFAWPDAQGRRLLERAVDGGLLSGRGHDRVLRVARTIADLEGHTTITSDHVLDALTLRDAERDLDQPV